MFTQKVTETHFDETYNAQSYPNCALNRPGLLGSIQGIASCSIPTAGCWLCPHQLETSTRPSAYESSNATVSARACSQGTCNLANGIQESPQSLSSHHDPACILPRDSTILVSHLCASVRLTSEVESRCIGLLSTFLEYAYSEQVTDLMPTSLPQPLSQPSISLASIAPLMASITVPQEALNGMARPLGALQ